MSLNIRLKHSASANKKPQVTDLKSGELALNINGSSPAGYALDDAGAVQQMFGKATETQEGQAEIATQPEVDAGTDDERIVTPAKLGQRLTDYTTNTVTPAIAVETAARTAADTTEKNARIAADTAEETARIAAIAAEETARIDADNLRVLKAGDTMTGNLSVPSINDGPLAGLRNQIINGNFTINQRQQSKITAVGTYGYDRWKSVASNNLMQTVEALPAGEYTLSWSGGGNGTVFGTTGTSPITATNASSGDIEVTVPNTATNVQLEPGPRATPFELRPRALELSLCQRYYYQSNCRIYLHLLFVAGANPPKYGGQIAHPVTMRRQPTYDQAGSTLTNIQTTAGLFYWPFLARSTLNSIAFTGQQVADSESYVEDLQLDAEY